MAGQLILVLGRHVIIVSKRKINPLQEWAFIDFPCDDLWTFSTTFQDGFETVEPELALLLLLAMTGPAFRGENGSDKVVVEVALENFFSKSCRFNEHCGDQGERDGGFHSKKLSFNRTPQTTRGDIAKSRLEGVGNHGEDSTELLREKVWRKLSWKRLARKVLLVSLRCFTAE